MFTVVVLIVALVLLVALDTVKKRRLYPAIPTVSPCYPLVGNVLKFQGQTLEQKFRTLTTIFSTAPRLFKLWLGPVMVVGVTHPELIQKLLNDPNCLEKPFFYDFLNMKHGLISARSELNNVLEEEVLFLKLHTIPSRFLEGQPKSAQPNDEREVPARFDTSV